MFHFGMFGVHIWDDRVPWDFFSVKNVLWHCSNVIVYLMDDPVVYYILEKREKNN